MRSAYGLVFLMLLGCDSSSGLTGDTDASCEPTTTGGECNVLGQCGCSGSERCELRFEDVVCLFVESCFDFTGTTAFGEYCDAGDQCAPGHTCVFDSSGTSGSCTTWCETEDDCTEPGSSCTVEVAAGGGTCGIVVAPHSTCSTD